MRPAPLLIALSVIASALVPAAAHAQEAPSAAGRERYFVDFRARPGALWGHTFIVYGRLNGAGAATEAGRAGLYPDDGQPGLILGTFVPVPATVRAVPDDFSESPSAIYRRALSAAEFAKLKSAVKVLRARDRNWHMLMYNCNGFADTIATELGLTTPPNLLVPNAWVRALKAMNER